MSHALLQEMELHILNEGHQLTFVVVFETTLQLKMA